MYGTQTFMLNCTDPTNSSLQAAKPADTLVDVKHIPEEYHDFADVFNKAKANTLAPHHSYNLKINLEEGSTPTFGPI